MRLVSYGSPGAEVPGVLVDDQILPLGPLAAELGLAPHTSLRGLLPVLNQVADRLGATAGLGGDLIPLGEARLGPPIVDPPNIFVCGANYQAHLIEVGHFDKNRLPTLPVIFQKPLSALSGPYDPVIRPPETQRLDYEAELAVVIGKGGHRIRAEDAHEHIAGYMISNDVSTRDLGAGESLTMNSQALIQMMRAKGWDTFLPTGPWLVTADEAGPFGDIRIQLSVNDAPRQDGFAGEMDRSPAELIEWLSATTTLRPGDILTTGTPGGVAAGMNPPRWLLPGDIIRIEMTGLGAMETPVVNEKLPNDNDHLLLEVALPAPAVSGLHHITSPVSDLAAAISWYERLLGAEHLTALDHYNPRGEWSAAVLAEPAWPGRTERMSASPLPRAVAATAVSPPTGRRNILT